MNEEEYEKLYNLILHNIDDCETGKYLVLSELTEMRFKQVE